MHEACGFAIKPDAAGSYVAAKAAHLGWCESHKLLADKPVHVGPFHEEDVRFELRLRRYEMRDYALQKLFKMPSSADGFETFGLPPLFHLPRDDLELLKEWQEDALEIAVARAAYLNILAELRGLDAYKAKLEQLRPPPPKEEQLAALAYDILMDKDSKDSVRMAQSAAKAERAPTPGPTPVALKQFESRLFDAAAETAGGGSAASASLLSLMLADSAKAGTGARPALSASAAAASAPSAAGPAAKRARREESGV